ncbi:unnamed protein product, partial [Rotaria magnacalcarata]
MGARAAKEYVCIALVKATKDRESSIRQKAFQALEKIGSKAVTLHVIDAMIHGTTDKDSAV